MYWTHFLGIWNIHIQKFIYWGSFEFEGHVTDAYSCCCMGLQSAGVSFFEIFKSFIRVIDDLVVFLWCDRNTEPLEFW